MAKLTIDTGTAGNPATGDTLRTAMTKVNANFTELYRPSGTATISSGALDIDFSKGVVTVAHTENITSITFSNVTTDSKNEIVVVLTQDSTGGRTITSSGYSTAGGLGLDISTTANHVNIITFLTTDGTTVYGFSNGKNFG
tara:strand:- start:29 stop:451 length:423 start_codon:yes stop_codon:yes gene_type:complete